MNRLIIRLAAVSAMAVLAACGGNGTKFNPAEDNRDSRDSTAVVAARPAGALEEVLAMRGVKVSVIAPELPAGFSRAEADGIAARLVNVCAANGISGLGTSPGFVLGTTIIPGSEQQTGTAPQKTIVEYELVYSVGNAATGDIYASTTQRITGAGRDAADARRNALRQIKSTPAL